MLDVIANNYVKVDYVNVLYNNLTQKHTRDNLVSYLNGWDTFNSRISYRQICSTMYGVIDADGKINK